ncbi:MAG: VOC family protein [Nocardioidaceae bacterium]|jgi:catechol 2,3-dioxygenase-like lactoylglutathione lyase family enzyme|nr:VOC family protein [Nocardioidaceae bacterium]
MTTVSPQPLVDSRVQLAINVDDVDTAVAFYSQLFDAEPHKRRNGYANFALTHPPLKLVLVENPGHGGTLNHLGVEVGSSDEVSATTTRLARSGLDTLVEDATTCCYAVQDKVWVTGPGGERWEVYTILDDAPVTEASSTTDSCCTASNSSCCTSDGQCAS